MKKRFRISPLLLYRLLRTEMLRRYIEQCRNTDTTTERNPRRSHFGIENCRHRRFRRHRQITNRRRDDDFQQGDPARCRRCWLSVSLSAYW